MESCLASYRESPEKSQSETTDGQSVAQRSSTVTSSTSQSNITASQAERRYNFEINSQEDLNEINRLENTHGVDTVRKWSNEGMPREAMGVPKKMKQFYETDSTQQQPTPVQRSTKTETGSPQAEPGYNKKKETIKNLPDLSKRIKESKFGKWTKQVFQDLHPGSKKGTKHSKSTVLDPNSQPSHQGMHRAETSPAPIAGQSAGTPLPTPTVLPGSISAVDIPSSLPPILEHDSELAPISEYGSTSSSTSEYGSTSSSTSEYGSTSSSTSESDPVPTQEQDLADQFNQYNRRSPSQPGPELEARLQQEAVDYMNTVETTPGVAASTYIPGTYLPTVDRSVDETKQKARSHAERFGLPIPDPDQTTGVDTGRAKREESAPPRPIPQIQTGTLEIEPTSTQPSPRTQLPASESDPVLTQEQYLAAQFNQYNHRSPSQPSPELEARLQQEAVDYINTVGIPPGEPASMHIPGKYLPTVDRSVDETKQKALAYAKRLGITINEPEPPTGGATRKTTTLVPPSTRPTPRSQVPSPKSDPVLTQEQHLADQFNQYNRHPPSQPSPETEARLQQAAVDYLNTVGTTPSEPASMRIPGTYLPTVDRSVDETKQKALAYAERLGVTTTNPDPTTGVATGKANRILSSGLPGTKHMTFRQRLLPEMQKKQKLRDKVKIAESKGDTETKQTLETEIETANRSNAAKMGERTKQLQQHLGAPTVAANGKTDAENRQEAIRKAQDEMIDAELATHAAFFDSMHAEKNGSSTARKQAKTHHKAAQKREKQIRQTNKTVISDYITAETEMRHPWGPRVNVGSELERRKRHWKAVQRDNTVYGNTFVSYFKGGKNMERDAIRSRAKLISLGTGLLPPGFLTGFFL